MIIGGAQSEMEIKEQFASWKIKFDIDFDIHHDITYEEKIAEHNLVSSLIAAEQKI